MSLSKLNPGPWCLTGLRKAGAVPVAQKPVGPLAIPTLISVGVVPAQKRSRETTSAGPRPSMVGVLCPLSSEAVPLVLVILWKKVAGSDLHLPTPPGLEILALKWKTVVFLQARKSVLVPGSGLSEPWKALHS